MNQILFIIDPVESLNFKKDSTIAMIAAAQRFGLSVWIAEPLDLSIEDNEVRVKARQIAFNGFGQAWFEVLSEETVPGCSFEVIFMRKDPPIDDAYRYACQLLTLLAKQGVQVVNPPESLLTLNEKIIITYFPQCIPETLISCDPQSLKQFARDYFDVIFKPLDGMGGEGIFRIREGEPNLNVIIEQLTQKGRRAIMAQRYLPEVVQGDKRILLIDGEPVNYCVARMPQQGETRANLAAGGYAQIQPLTDRDRWLCTQIAPQLESWGLRFVGIDVIGQYITEINITSPTCLRELLHEKDIDVAAELLLKLVTL